MNILLLICFFLVILTLYLHIIKEFSYSENLNVYETDFINDQNFNKICSLQQPFIMYLDLNCEYVIEKEVELNVKDICDNEMVSLSYDSFNNLLDQNKDYYSDNNHDFVIMNLKTNYSDFDLILRPYLNMNTKYDYLSGSSLVKTNTKYHTSSRLFLYVKNGSITVKFACWKSRELFGPFIDYDNLNLLTEKNIWDVCDDTIRIEVKEGHILFIPPYWFYSIQFNEKSEVLYFEYQTIMNFILNSHHLCLHYLQSSNINSKVLEYANLII